MSEHFRYFVETARDSGCHVIDRNNLTIIETKAYGWLPEYLAAHDVEVVASLPCYLAEMWTPSAATACSRKALAL